MEKLFAMFAQHTQPENFLSMPWCLHLCSYLFHSLDLSLCLPLFLSFSIYTCMCVCVRNYINTHTHARTHTHIQAHIYIYIYIYNHPHTDCFIVSQLISVARHAECFKLGLNPDQLYIRLSIISLSQQSTYVRSGIIRHYVIAFACLHLALLDTRVLNSYEELWIVRVAVINSPARVLVEHIRHASSLHKEIGTVINCATKSWRRLYTHLIASLT